MNHHRVALTVTALIANALLATSCTTPTPAPTPTAARPTACHAGVCIRSAFVYLDDSTDTIRVEFALVDNSGEVKVGDAPEFRGDITVGFFRPSDGTFLFAATIPEDLYVCYAGNDIPWAGGQYASSCGFTLPASQFQFRPSVGDEVRVETIEFNSVDVTTIQPEQ